MGIEGAASDRLEALQLPRSLGRGGGGGKGEEGMVGGEGDGGGVVGEGWWGRGRGWGGEAMKNKRSPRRIQQKNCDRWQGLVKDNEQR